MKRSTQSHSSDVRIVLLGRNEAEISAVGNMIVKRKAFKESRREVCEVQRGRVEERNISVIDTPGFINAEVTDEDLQNEMMKSLSLSHPGPHVFLLIVRPDTFTEDDVRNIIQKIEETFGAHVLKFTLVLFIREQMKSREWMILQLSQKYQDLISHFKGKYHVMNSHSDTTEITTLLEKIDDVIKQNDNQYYSNDNYVKFKMIQKQEQEKVQVVKTKSHKRPSSTSQQHPTSPVMRQHEDKAFGEVHQLQTRFQDLKIEAKSGAGKSATRNTIPVNNLLREERSSKVSHQTDEHFINEMYKDAQRKCVEEQKIKREEEQRKRQEEQIKREEGQRKRQEEQRKREEEQRKRQEEQIKREEEQRKREEEQRKRQEEQRKRQEEQIKREEGQRKRQEEQIKREEEQRKRQEEQRKREEEQRKRQEEQIKREEEQRKREEEQRKRQEEQRKRQEEQIKREEGQRKRQEEQIKREEGQRKRQEEQRKREEEQRKREEEQRKREEEQRKRVEEQRKREEEQRKREEGQRKRQEEQIKREEGQRKRQEEQRKREEGQRKREEEQRKREEEQRKRVEEQRKREEEQRKREEEQIKREEEQRRQEEELRNKEEELINREENVKNREEQLKSREEEQRKKEQKEQLKRIYTEMKINELVEMMSIRRRTPANRVTVMAALHTASADVIRHKPKT